MGTLVPIGKSKPPSKLLARKGQSSSVTNFTEGVTDSFPRLGIRGKSWWVKMNGKEIRAGAVDQEAGPIIDLVLVNAGKYMSKAYYAKAYGGAGEGEQPDCWSLDAMRPDPSVVHKQNDVCPTCEKNAFNSAPSGRGGKACQDSKRVVVTTADQLDKDIPVLLMLRVPQQSHKNMKNYMENLVRHGYTEPYSCISRLSFDQSVEFPKIQFDFVEPLTDEEFEAAEALANSKKVNDMLKNPDFDNAASAVNAPHANDDETTKLQHKKRAPQQGLGNLAAAEEATPADQQTKRAEPESVSRETQQEDEWEDLGDGTEVNLSTGDTRAKAEPEMLETDPDVMKLKDGRFFNRVTKKVVDSPYKETSGPKPAPKVEEPEEKPKKTRKPRAVKAAEPEEKAEPVQASGNGSNGMDMPQPKVVAATPQLDQLLGGLVPNPDEK